MARSDPRPLLAAAVATVCLVGPVAGQVRYDGPANPKTGGASLSSPTGRRVPATSQPTTAPIGMTRQTLTLDGMSAGRIFDGVGGVSSGGSSRLLFDYPEPARSDILDYLFKPGYGAALQLLKVEIGGDANATSGAEASHERKKGQIQDDRGYEWWLMAEAKKRNPDIVFAGLAWSAPGWLNGGFWSQDNVDYQMNWLDIAKKKGFKISYVGGWNERKYKGDWYVKLRAALKARHPDVKVIAADEHAPLEWWRIAQSMADDKAFNDSVDVVGTHSPGGWRSLYQEYKVTPVALGLNKPLWNSEQSALSHDVGGGPWARGLNRAYIDARITATLAWTPVASWYANLPLADTGFILAEWPWSSYYVVGNSIWVNAHTTQFAKPGWKYLDTACGYLDNYGSYVTLAAPDGKDWSTIVETMDATEPARVTFKLAGGLSGGTVHVWSTDLRSQDESDDDFIHERTVEPKDGAFTLTFEPGHVYSLTTTTGQGKGTAAPKSTVFDQLPLPFVEDFESYKPGQLARFFSDVNGAFEVAPATGGRSGMVYRQVIDAPLTRWNADGLIPPTTLVGDPRWWGDYEASVDVMLEQPGYVELIGRVGAQRRRGVSGYHVQFDSKGTWSLYTQDLPLVREKDIPLAQGTAPFEAGKWHTVALRMKGSTIEIVVDAKVVGTVTDTRHTTGNIALRVSDWHNAQFDNFKVTPTGPAPEFIPQSEMTATATSERTLNFRGDYYAAADAIDGRPESFWHTQWEPTKAALPQSITFDLGKPRDVQALTYQPRIDNAPDGMITKYAIHVSDDGKTFRQVTTGEWEISTGTKIASWPAGQARFVRLEALEAANGMASAGEIRLSATPLSPTPPPPGPAEGLTLPKATEPPPDN